ncbi:CapA family protein [Nesterenkonia halotolerans]|uniref:Poly-gamma-glutamate synthesis protein (Capsule biosynthesis protein) n=1 Tax=Nesterenkonia halotolerans TaxID=225325 RepID=A0ABR9J4Y4_9MICC|nr:CapA family protein [Nesterenkonia halotolerans]MBE1514029.1 poly-gamma-glutamate synthesis protein (capsule biosynthesis protein) [Nesterenkonia halotolerans]
MADAQSARGSVPVFLSWVLAAALALSGCANADGGNRNGDDAADELSAAEEPAPGESASDQFTIAATGDVLLHDNILDEAAELADGQDYSFAPLMSGVEDLIDGADLALCGLEVPIAPRGVDPVGYPVFAAPAEIAADLAEVGFDGCSTANNHSFDQGTDGQERTLEVLDEAGLGHAGTARTPAEAAQPQLYRLERGGREVTVAHLATTMLHNQGYPPPEDEPWRVSDVGPEELTTQAARAREEGADVVVASVHWGEEYTDAPAEAQRDYGEQLAVGGEIDAVFGSHPHTPQPVERLDGGPAEEGMWLVWSMGNFLSNQDEACCAPEAASGTVAYATVEVDDDGARVSSMDWLPVTVDRGPTDEEPHRGIWPLRELAEEDVPAEVELSEETIADRWSGILDVMTDRDLREQPPSSTGDASVVVPRSG